MKRSMSILSFTRLSLITALIALSACATNPVTGKKQISLMSEQQEIALGAESDPQIIAQFGLYEDAELQQFITKYGNQMAAISHRPHLKYQFRILDSPVVNAFAVPGGYVYFTRGILAHFNNEAAFAGVLGHEIGHITARHSAEQYTNSILGQAALIGGLIVSKEVRAFSREAQYAMEMLFLKYSRDNESQSDELGVEYATKIGYDTREMAKFFQTLDALSDSDEEIPSFLSTHPNPANRFEKVTEMTAEEQSQAALSSYKVNRDSYLRMIDGIVYGDDPRQGYVDGGTFYHPGLKFQFPVPSNWQLINTPNQVQMVDQQGKALLLLTLAQGDNLTIAANNAMEQNQLTPKSNREVAVNGLPGLEVISEQVTQDQSSGQSVTLRIQSLFIDYGKQIYVFHGLSTAGNGGRYDPTFDKTMYGFKELKDPAKIQVQPDRIRVVEVKSEGTLGQALNAYGQPSGKQKELAIINGLDLSDKVAKGSLIKILSTEPR